MFQTRNPNTMKTALSPKEISKKRLAKHKLMKIRLDERNDIKSNEKEMKIPQYPIKPKTTYKKHDRVREDCGVRNPFDAPNNQRIFTKSRGLLTTKSEPFIMNEPRTICDIDPTFFRIVEGRPLRQHNDIKVYMRNIRDITLFKANAAYLKDRIIKINTSFAFENAEYNDIDNFFIKCKDNFVQFAKESYFEAKRIQQLAEDKASQINAASEELDSLCFEYVELRMKLGVIMINFETLSKYGNFLDSISPMSWREKNCQWFDTKSSVLSAESSGFKLTENSLADYKEPKLYFTKPKQMAMIFENLGRQCLSYFQIHGFASGLVASVIKRKNYLKAQVMEEIEMLQHLIRAHEGYVKFMEEKEQECKTKFHRVLENEFQTLYSSYDASKLFTCLQYTNTQVFHGPEDPKDTMTMLTLRLETEYMVLTSALDNLNQAVVKEAANDFFSEDLSTMRRAHLAHRNLKECDILSKALYVSFEPPRPRWKCNK